MELPRALQPWRQSLSIFPRDLAIALGGVIDKLSLLLGPIISPNSAGRHEPDGIDGVGRRGSFERLLTTEWALADEAPLEFLRRVSTGELSFLEIAHQKPTIAKRCVALFDVGPDQRGAPRIVHLAALILLAQRAQTAGASFTWGILQNTNCELISDVNEESVRNLLKPGSPRRMVIEDAIKFYQAIQDDNAEVWFVGGTGASQLVQEIGAYRVVIEDSFDPDEPFDLDITVTDPRGKPRSAHLQLPAGNTSVRLLRDPFQVGRTLPGKSSTRIDPNTNIVFTADGRKVFLQGASGELVSIPIPNSPNYTETPKPRIFRPPRDERIVAVGRLSGTRTVAVATLNPTEVIVHELSPRLASSTRHQTYAWDFSSSPMPMPYFPPWFQERHAPAPLGQLFQIAKNGPLYLYDEGRMLFMFEGNAVRAWDFPVSAAHQTSGTLSWLRHGEPATWLSHHGAVPSGLQMPTNVLDSRILLGGHLAIKISATTWQVINAQCEVVHTRDIADDQGHLLGIASMKNHWFFLLDPTRTCIWYLDGETKEVCHTSAVPIRTIQATPGCWYIAFITEEDELCIYSRDHKTLVLRLRLGDA